MEILSIDLHILVNSISILTTIYINLQVLVISFFSLKDLKYNV